MVLFDAPEKSQDVAIRSVETDSHNGIFDRSDDLKFDHSVVAQYYFYVTRIGQLL